ncbi:RNA-binding S4 domain-containing protein [bacterium]|nr:RNA-binding S4 domain-containing protein [bacterium]
MAEALRLDHYLFRARLFKSRSQATNACKEGRIQINDVTGKASSDVHEDDVIKIRVKGLYRHIRVLVLPGKNMAKDKAKETWRDETPEDVLKQWEMIHLAQRGMAHKDEGPRPTKKERRDLRKIRGH